MAYDVPKVVLQACSTVYSPIKDMISCMKGKAKYVKNLEDNLTKITAELAIFYSRKEQIDRTLETTVSKEKSDEYNILLKQIEVFHTRYDKFVMKYGKYCQNLPSFQVNDISSSATNVIDVVQERKPPILTHKFFKFAELSREINELLDHISQVTDKMKPENVLRDKKIEPVQVKHDDIDLPSSTEYVDKILRYLKEDDNRSIGILGPIGVGKTTIMKRLNNQLKHSPSHSSEMTMKIEFDAVIWIDYHKQQDAEDKISEVIQDVIMRRLKLDREKANSIEQNEDIISGALWDKKYILLIDQVSSTINLNEVGIHKDHKFGKVVVASSNKKVIKTMTDQHVEIQSLSQNDALDLFQNVCGRINDKRIKLTADSIVRSCGGLPLVIKLVAKYLIGEKDEEVWSEVKRVLQSETKAAKLLKLGGVGHAYKLVYDKLEESHKKCLLFVTLFPSDHKIYKDYLVECWNAERFLELDIQELIRMARGCGATVLKELTDQYLLENYSDKHVKMPEYFRKVALQQEYPGEKNCLSWPPENIQLLTEETWRTTKRMSLICCKSELPESPESHNISTLLMQCKPGLVALEDMFFLNMKNLRILDLNQTRIESLPISITSLVSLICLYLNDCPLLIELPPEVKSLEKLELLDIRGTSIRSLPSEMGDMTHLRCLRISFSQKGCNDGKVSEVEMTIPLHMFSRLQQLEELTIEVGCCSPAWDNIADQIVIELTCLEKLSTLEFHFPRVSSLKKFVTESKSLKKTDTHWKTNTFRSFNISIGCCKMQHPYGLDISGILAERQLRFSTNEEISSVGEILMQASSFELVSHSGVESLSDFNLENAGALKVCVVECCNNMMSIVDVSKTSEMHMDNMEKTDCAILQCLEKLYLFKLQSLQCIWKGPVLSGCLANLKVLTLNGCPELTTILNHEQAKALSNLEYVKVENCAKVVEIIREEISNGIKISEDVDLSDILNKVTTIELVNLPCLQNVCKSTSTNWKSLVKIVIISCSRLRDFHLTSSNAVKMEKIKCEASWWTALQLPDEQKQLFLPRCDFFVVEKNLSIRATYEGESSEHGGSTDPLSSNVNVSKKYNGKVVSRNENHLMMPNINSVEHADKHKEVNPSHQDSPESSHVTHQSTNTNASANNEAFPLPDERCSKMDFSIFSH